MYFASLSPTQDQNVCVSAAGCRLAPPGWPCVKWPREGHLLAAFSALDPFLHWDAPGMPRGSVRRLGVLTLALASGVHAQNTTLAPRPDHKGTTDPTWAEYDASFAQFLPPVFRVLLMLALGIAVFGADLHILQRWNMNVWNAVGPTRLPLHRQHDDGRHDALRESGAWSLYLLAASHLAWLLLCWVLYRYNLDPIGNARTPIAQIWEVVALVGLGAFWLLPSPFGHVQRATLRYVAD